MGITYRERREHRAERREEWAKKREKRADSRFAQVDEIADGIPPEQPVLVGHHSEKRHRRDLDRMATGMRKGFEHRDMAKRHRADTIRHQLDSFDLR